MADKFMRIGGRSEEGFSKPLKVSDEGAFYQQLSEAQFASDVYEKIINVIGGSNIKMMLPMWEREGDTLKDIMNPDISFNRIGATLGQPGLLHPVPHFERANANALVQSPKTGNEAYTTTLPFRGGEKVAQFIKSIGTKVPFVRFRLRKYGSAASATLRAVLHEDNAGQVGAVVDGGTSETFNFNSVAVGQYVSFYFTQKPTLKANKRYWVVMEYENAVGVDETNYIAAYYDSANAYGEKRAHYDGTAWAIHEGENFAFDVYDDSLELPGDFTIIAAVKNEAEGLDFPNMYIAGTSANSTESLSIALRDGGISAQTRSYGAQQTTSEKWIQDEWRVISLTFNVASSDNKVRLFVDHVQQSTSNGYAGEANGIARQPFCIGGLISATGSISNQFQGKMGPFIITTNTLTPSQIAEISFLLRSRARMGIKL